MWGRRRITPPPAPLFDATQLARRRVQPRRPWLNGSLNHTLGRLSLGLTWQSRHAENANASRATAALDNYQLDTGYYPSSEQGLQALVQQPSGNPPAQGWRGPYLKAKELPKDPWGNAFVYASPGKVNTEWYDLVSYGKDGREGGDGDAADIANW